MSPAHGISRGDVGSELPKTSSLANLPGTRASRREQTSSCACSNSKTCKTHRHSAGNKEHTGSTLTARTGFCLLRLLRKKPLHWRWGGQAGGSTHTHAHTCTHATAKGSLVTSGSPAAGRRPDCLPGSAHHLQRCLNYLHFLLSS